MYKRQVTIRDAATLRTWVDAIRQQGSVALDTETTSLDEMQAELVGISICPDIGMAAYIPLGHVAGEADLFGGGARAAGQMDMDEALAMLKPLLEDPAILKILHNAKYDWKLLARHGIAVAPVEDTMLMSYALNAALHNHGMDELAERYVGHRCQPIKDLILSLIHI